MAAEVRFSKWIKEAGLTDYLDFWQIILDIIAFKTFLNLAGINVFFKSVRHNKFN